MKKFKIRLNNAHYNLYAYLKTVTAELNEDGSVIIDGVLMCPGDKVYKDTAGKLVPMSEALKNDYEAECQPYIDQLIKASKEINRKVSKNHLGGRENLIAWRKARYPKSLTFNNHYDTVDRITDVHDPKALRDWAIEEHLRTRLCFEFGGYLHPYSDVDLVKEDFLQAALAYKALGGGLGRPVLAAITNRGF